MKLAVDADPTEAIRRGWSWWVVATPIQERGNGNYEPPDVFRDVALVAAPNRRAALWTAWAVWRREDAPWAQDHQIDVDGHPLAGLRAEPGPKWPTVNTIDEWAPWVGMADA